MAVQIQLRNDTAANWTAADPILAQGEMGLETDTRLFKIGNGVDTWSELEYGAVGLPDTIDGGTAQSESDRIEILWHSQVTQASAQ